MSPGGKLALILGDVTIANSRLVTDSKGLRTAGAIGDSLQQIKRKHAQFFPPAWALFIGWVEVDDHFTHYQIEGQQIRVTRRNQAIALHRLKGRCLSLPSAGVSWL